VSCESVGLLLQPLTAQATGHPTVNIAMILGRACRRRLGVRARFKRTGRDRCLATEASPLQLRGSMVALQTGSIRQASLSEPGTEHRAPGAPDNRRRSLRSLLRRRQDDTSVFVRATTGTMRAWL